MNTDTAIQQLHDAFRGNFMQPRVYRGKDIEEEVLNAGLDLEDNKFYCQLSAYGYMDQTDLTGPFDSIAECAFYLIDTYTDED